MHTHYRANSFYILIIHKNRRRLNRNILETRNTPKAHTRMQLSAANAVCVFAECTQEVIGYLKEIKWP